MSKQQLKAKQKAIFLDRDDVLNRDSNYTYRVEDLEILPGVVEGLKILRDAGYLFFVVTNQSGVARGLFTLAEAMAFNDKMSQILRDEHGLNLQAFFVCPHHPDGTVKQYTFQCECRKPEPTFVLNALRDFEIDAAQSYFVGDRDSDIECGQRAGLKTVFIKGREMKCKPDFVAKNLLETAQLITK